MSEFERLGPCRFWDERGNDIQTADEKVVMPVLSELEAEVVGDKWPFQVNFYLVWIRDRPCQICFDFLDSSSRCPELALKTWVGGQFDFIGTFSPDNSDSQTAKEEFRKLIQERVLQSV